MEKPMDATTSLIVSALIVVPAYVALRFALYVYRFIQAWRKTHRIDIAI